MKWIKKKLTNLKQVHKAVGQIPSVLKPENNPLWLDALSSGPVMIAVASLVSAFVSVNL